MRGSNTGIYEIPTIQSVKQAKYSGRATLHFWILYSLVRVLFLPNLVFFQKNGQYSLLFFAKHLLFKKKAIHFASV